MDLPPVGSECDYQRCLQTDDWTSLSRCSVCKNQFYCSAKCQKSDWATHRFNCSALPSVGGAPGSEVLIDDDFKSQVSRLATLVEGISTEMQSVGDRPPASLFAPILSLDIPPHLQYSRKPEHHEHCKYRLPLITISRLFFIDLVASLHTEEDREKFTECFREMLVPSSCPQLYGPKLLTRPADLSPGEYEMLMEIGPLFAMTAAIPGGPDLKWMHLSVVAKRVLKAGTPQTKRG